MTNKMKNAVGNYILDTYKRRKERLADVSQAHSLDVAKAMLKKAKYCHLISHNENGWSSARLVQPIVDLDAFTLWIGTHPDSRKVSEIRQNSKVTLAFMDEKEDANLIIYGEARIETDVAVKKSHWKGTWRLFFPNGPASDAYVVIRIEPVRMEIMNFSRNVVKRPFGLKPAVLIKNNNQWNVE